MLDRFPPEVWEPSKTFCDPACGNGNMVVEVLRRKLQIGHQPLQAISTVYGVDIMPDNIKECRLRLLKTISDSGADIAIEIVRASINNIVVTTLEKFPNGSLDYDFGFYRKIELDDPHVQRWFAGISQERWLDRFETEDLDQLIEIDEYNAIRDDPAYTLFSLET